MPKVSVCIPVYNVEQYIGRCIASVQRQSLKDIEIIVVNDCTPDASMEIVRQYAEADKRIKIVEHDVNHGLMVARRTGYMAATGDYITFCDSDDTLPPGALMALYEAAIRENADIVSGTIEYVPTHGERRLWSNKLSYGNDKKAVFRSLLVHEFGHNLCSKLFRSDLLQRHEHEYETHERATNGEDAMLFYQVVDNIKKVIIIDAIVYEYWQNMESSSQAKLSDNALRSIAIANATTARVVGQYADLQVLLDRSISRSYWGFKIAGYDIEKYFKAQSLNKYCSIRSLFQYQSFPKALRILAKWAYYKLK